MPKNSPVAAPGINAIVSTLGLKESSWKTAVQANVLKKKIKNTQRLLLLSWAGINSL